MNWEEAAYANSELVSIAERLHRCIDNKKMLELELANEEFNHRYIYKRKKFTAEKAVFRMGFIVPVTLIVAVCIAVFIVCYASMSGGGYNKICAFGMLASALVVMFMGYICMKLWIPEIKMIKKLNKPKKHAGEESDIVTFDEEEEKSRNKIENLKVQISSLEKEISLLTLRQKEQETLLHEKISAEKETSYIGDSDSEHGSLDGKFRIKKEKVSQIQSTELRDFYNKEIQGYKDSILRMEAEDKKLQKQILDIDADYKLVKERIVIFFAVTIILTLGQNIFSGVVYNVLSVIICAVILGHFMWLINVCTNPVILYLVEHNNRQIQDYAFVNNLVPVAEKRREIAREIADCNDKIREYEHKKQKLDMEE